MGFLVNGIIFGLITEYVANSKGYEGGFWWGFFLGVIGLLVVGFRPNLQQESHYSYENTSKYYFSSPSAIDEAEIVETSKSVPQKDEKWVCIKCQTSNPEKSKFCCECGEVRHYEWKCTKCGEINEPKVKFCFNCGKEKALEEELIPSIETIEGNDSILEKYTVINDNEIRCNKCGTVQPAKRLVGVCYKCGTRFSK